MDLKKFRKNLIKINDFDNWEDIPEGKLSRIERDVLLNYIRKLYDAVLNGEYENPELKKSKSHSKDKTNRTKDHDHLKERLDTAIIEKAEYIEKTKKPAVIETEEKVEKETSGLDRPSDDQKVMTVNADPDIFTKSEDVASEKMEEPLDQLSVPEIKIPDDISFSDDFMAIFTAKVSHELSEKLSMMPIGDLRKAFGINEKIFTVNELFGSDMKYFDQVISELNEMASFNEAKNYVLRNLVSRFKWDEKPNHKKVETFIRTIRRRYLI
jgi:hypothetical protein